jgi:hypothetical protein
MKKFVAFSLGAMLTMGFAACSDDDVTSPSNVDETTTAYMNLNIITSDDATTRADVDPVLSQGVANEHKVSSVVFYFFDASQKFISKDEVTGASFSNETDGGNVESKAEGIVAIPKFDTLNPPKYLVTVLNPTESINLEGKTLNDFYAMADGSFKVNENLPAEDSQRYRTGVSDTNEFVMTTSTYKRSDSTPNYVTDLTDATFYETKKLAEEETDKNKYTTVYVERLAAKVGLDFGESVKEYWDKNTDMDHVFKLGKFDLNYTGKKNTVLYAKFISWGLDGTAKKTYYSKHINEGWDTYLLGTGIPWNDEARFRSYWAQSYYYATGTESTFTFPDMYKEISTTSDTYSVNNKVYYKGFPLNFVSLNETNTSFGDPIYCGENTNSSAFLSASTNIAGVATCALLYAQLMKFNEEKQTLESAGDIVKYEGHYYDADVLAQKFLDVLTNAHGTLKYAAATEAAEKAIALVADDLSYDKDDDLKNGRVEIQLSSTIPADAKWYDGDGGLLEGVTTATVDGYLDKIQLANPMVMYRDGMMYYYTPVYHLSNNAINESTIPEGYYGVVRNHWYKLTITGFRKSSSEDPYDPKNPEKDPTEPSGDTPSDTYGPEGPDDDKDPIDPGHGVDDPDEPIIPTTEDDINYYLGVNINVLSWRVVNQHIKL